MGEQKINDQGDTEDNSQRYTTAYLTMDSKRMINELLDLILMRKDDNHKKLHDTLLHAVNYILADFGQPHDYYLTSCMHQPSQEQLDRVNGINKVISHIVRTHDVLFTESFEPLVQNIYLESVLDGKKEATKNKITSKKLENDKEYCEFYLALRENTHLWPYGEGNRKDEPSPPYIGLLSRLMKTKQLLELGYNLDCNTVAKKYRAKVHGGGAQDRDFV